MLSEFTARNKGHKNSTDIMNSFTVVIVILLHEYPKILSEKGKGRGGFISNK